MKLLPGRNCNQATLRQEPGKNGSTLPLMDFANHHARSAIGDALAALKYASGRPWRQGAPATAAASTNGRVRVRRNVADSAPHARVMQGAMEVWNHQGDTWAVVFPGRTVFAQKLLQLLQCCAARLMR